MSLTRSIALLLVASSVVAPFPHGASAQASGAPATLRWFKGNTHTHTLNSDGDSPPVDVVRWYREQGYQFVVITDHEYLTDVAPLNGLMGARDRFLVIQGQEVTQVLDDKSHPEGRRQAHVNAIGLSSVVMPQGGATVAESYRRNLTAIRGAGGLAQVNHPNWRWSVQPVDMLALPDSTLFELWNGHPGINNLGGAVERDGRIERSLSTEALWDTLLTRGKLLWGVGSDDSHNFMRPWDRGLARPGQAWVVVRAESLSAAAIIGALRRGDFYASTGIVLRDYQANATGVSVSIAAIPGARNDTRYRTEFIGVGGRVLRTTEGLEARYQFRGDEGYVRARVSDSHGWHAWTQPVVLPRGR